MNKAKLKAYAPQARKDFIAAVTARAHQIGLAEKNGSLEIAPAEKSGDFVIIAGQSWPAKISQQRANLIARIEKEGFAQTMEAVAYTWFNRFAALRYMEIHDYLSHGYRALSSREGGLPEILNVAAELAQNGGLPGLNAQQVIELKLAGDKDGELYRLTLIAQCNALSNVMPFLFERIDNETELLLPDNLLLTDSVIAKLVEAIPEQDWQDVEIVGWLYQFYISEKKDQVIGKVVKSEDIPAATQLFTPNWIVQYLVQNSVGRLWLMANPASLLKSDWPYYIEPAEQTPEVQAQLDTLIQSRMAEDGGSLNPETITVIDPACGSGHILVEAYDVLKAIYLERGYQLRSIPRLILEKNLYGLDIDDRAAQLAGFALLMKARADDRRLFDNALKFNVLALNESKGLDADELTQALSGYLTLTQPTITALIDTFAHAKTFGSLIQISPDLNAKLVTMDASLQLAVQNGDLLAQEAALKLLPLVRQARILGMQFDAVIANPPYMGGKYLTPILKSYLKDNYKGFEKDLFSAFMIRDLSLTNESGQLGFMSPFVWMFISSYQELRSHFIDNATLTSLIQLEYSGFDGATVPICTFTLSKAHVSAFMGSYIRLSDFRGADQQGPKTLEAIQSPNCGWFYTAKPDDFKKVPGSPLAYWISKAFQSCFSEKILSDYSYSDGKNITGDNGKFQRFFWEVDSIKIGMESRWFFISKGGGFQKWIGVNDVTTDWSEGARLHYKNDSVGRLVDKKLWGKEGISWGLITSSLPSFRLLNNETTFSDVGLFFNSDSDITPVLGLLNSKVALSILNLMNPTLNFPMDVVLKIPFIKPRSLSVITQNVNSLTEITKNSHSSHEVDWGFSDLDLISPPSANLINAFSSRLENTLRMCALAKNMEEENNRLFIEAYGLEDELSPEVPEEQITLARADREKDCQRLISYAIGCMMGRYSLDEPGLIYAHAGNVGFDPNRYNTFPADADGIVPITDELWFEDDAANRINEFLLAVWDAETLEENKAWLAESLGQKGNETPQETIRRYISGSFYKNHLQTYKKRPIYWLFSSGKQGAFQALVYLHRYNESTLSRMRAEYVVPLTGKIQSRIDMLKKDADAATSNAEKSKLGKDIDKLGKKYVELLSFDEKLRHYADLRIQLDLDDGVKVNYGKFGDLLAEVKAVTGGASDE